MHSIVIALVTERSASSRTAVALLAGFPVCVCESRVCVSLGPSAVSHLRKRCSFFPLACKDAAASKTLDTAVLQPQSTLWSVSYPETCPVTCPVSYPETCERVHDDSSWTIQIIRPNKLECLFLIFFHARPKQILYTVFATVASYHVYQVVDNKSKFWRSIF